MFKIFDLFFLASISNRLAQESYRITQFIDVAKLNLTTTPLCSSHKMPMTKIEQSSNDSISICCNGSINKPTRKFIIYINIFRRYLRVTYVNCKISVNFHLPVF